MKILLDTHALLWWALDAPELGHAARRLIRDPHSQVFVSAATGWEIATKVRLGKLPSAEALVPRLVGYLTDQAFTPLPVTLEHGLRAGSFRHEHRDPFDRMLIAQSLIEGMILASNETSFDALGVTRIW